MTTSTKKRVKGGAELDPQPRRANTTSKKSKSELYSNNSPVKKKVDPHNSDTKVDLNSSNKKKAREKDLKKGATAAQLPLKLKSPPMTEGTDKDPLDMTMNELRTEVLALREEVRTLRKEKELDRDRISSLTHELKKRRDSKD